MVSSLYLHTNSPEILCYLRDLLSRQSDFIFSHSVWVVGRLVPHPDSTIGRPVQESSLLCWVNFAVGVGHTPGERQAVDHISVDTRLADFQVMRISASVSIEVVLR